MIIWVQVVFSTFEMLHILSFSLLSTCIFTGKCVSNNLTLRKLLSISPFIKKLIEGVQVSQNASERESILIPEPVDFDVSA